MEDGNESFVAAEGLSSFLTKGHKSSYVCLGTRSHVLLWKSSFRSGADKMIRSTSNAIFSVTLLFMLKAAIVNLYACANKPRVHACGHLIVHFYAQNDVLGKHDE